MAQFDQVNFLLTREREQQTFASRARSVEAVEFHHRLAEHYGRLAKEAKEVVGA